MVYSEVPNFSEPNPELLAQANQQNKSVSGCAPTHSQHPRGHKTVFTTILFVFSKLCNGPFTSERFLFQAG